MYDKIKADDPEVSETQFGKSIGEFISMLEPEVNQAVETMKLVQ